MALSGCGGSAAVSERSEIRALHVIAGPADGSSMIFAKRESASLGATGVKVRQFFLESRTSPVSLFREFLRFRREIQDFRPEIVHAYYGTVTALFCALATWRRLVITFYGSDLNPDPAVSRVRSAISGLFSQMAALRAAQIICVTSGLKRRLWWRRERATVIPGGTDLEFFRPRPKEEARTILGWPKVEKIILFNAGRSPRIKRLDLAKAAVEATNKLGCDARLVLLNGGTAPSEVPLYLSAADCLLLTSDWEGSPFIVKEALSCNLPIVSVNVGDVAERVTGVNPSRIVARDAGALGAAVVEVLSLGCRSNGRLAMQELSEEKLAEKVRCIYERAVAGKHAAGSRRAEMLPQKCQAGKI
jgi:glycosyltransferase involved in cell wall biosynthesis